MPSLPPLDDNVIKKYLLKPAAKTAVNTPITQTPKGELPPLTDDVVQKFKLKPSAEASVPQPDSDPNDFLKVKADPNATSLTDVIKTPLKSAANLATAPVRAVKNLIYDIPKETIEVFKDAPTTGEAVKDIAGGAFDTAKNIVKPLEFTGNALAGAFAALVKKTTGLDIGNDEATKALDTLKDHLINNKLEDATTAAQAVHKLVTENPEQLVPILMGINKGLSTEAKPVIPGFKSDIETVPDIPAVPAKTVDIVSDIAKKTKIPQTVDKAVDKGISTMNKVKAPFKDSYLPEVAKDFKDEGLNAPVSAITTSPILQQSEAISSKFLFGRKIIDQINDTKNRVDLKTEQLIDKIKPVKTVSDENLGKNIQQGLNEFETNRKDSYDKIFKDFESKYGEAESYTPDTKSTLFNILKEQGNDYFKGINPKLQGFFDRLVGETPQVKKIRKTLADEGMSPETIEKVVSKTVEPPVLKYNELKATRTSIGEELSKDPENTALKRLYGALTSDLESGLSTLDEGAAKAFQKNNTKYKAYKDMLEGRIADSISKSAPERIVKNLITRNSADMLETVKTMIGPQRFKEVQKSFFRNLFDDSMTRDKFDVSKLKKNLAEYDNDTLQVALNPDQLEVLHDAIVKLERLERITGALKSSDKYTQGSQTAFLANAARLPGQIGTIFGAIFSGNIPLAAGLLADIGGEYATSKLFTSEFGKKLLTTGFKPFKSGAEEVPKPLSSSKNFGIENGKLIEPNKNDN